MNLAPDGLPISEIGRIDDAIRERIASYMSGSPAPDDLATIHRLSRQRVEMTAPTKLFEEVRVLLAQIAAAG
jgi:hypothetical protein